MLHYPGDRLGNVTKQSITILYLYFIIFLAPFFRVTNQRHIIINAIVC